MIAKKGELAALPTSEKLTRTPTIKCKNVICDIGFVDYKTATLTAKKQAGKNEPPKVINSRTVARHPWLEIVNYLNGAKRAELKNVF